MTHSGTYGGPLAAPPLSAPAPELRIARMRRHARRLTWSALILIAVAGATAYFRGRLPDPFQDWMLLAAAGLVVFLLVLLPWLAWVTTTYTITTRRVIVRSGIVARAKREMLHTRGYDVRIRRGPLQRIWRSGTLTLSNGVDAPLRLVDVPSVVLVHEVLVDQVEVGQILAHRDAQTGVAFPPPPPPPPLPGAAR